MRKITRESRWMAGVLYTSLRPSLLFFIISYSTFDCFRFYVSLQSEGIEDWKSVSRDSRGRSERREGRSGERVEEEEKKAGVQVFVPELLEELQEEGPPGRASEDILRQG